MYNFSINGIKIFSYIDRKTLPNSTLFTLKRYTKKIKIFEHIVVLPSAHDANGLIFGTQKHIIPGTIGNDIGCGVRATKITGKISDLLKNKEKIKLIATKLRENIGIPIRSPIKNIEKEKFINNFGKFNLETKKNFWIKLNKQVSTLGSGNHFLEIDRDQEGNLWILTHSGSRGLGGAISKIYNKIAKEIRIKKGKTRNESYDFLILKTEECNNFFEDLNFCYNYAEYNRKKLTDEVMEFLKPILGDIKPIKIIDSPHNFISLEKHSNEKLIIHRKGAIKICKGDFGVIPGSQGSASYIVEGLGQSMSYNSCSHGAGRKIQRRIARETLDLKAEMDFLKKKNLIYHSIDNVKSLDESSSAYNNIDSIIEKEKDIIKPIIKLTQLVVIKEYEDKADKYYKERDKRKKIQKKSVIGTYIASID